MTKQTTIVAIGSLRVNAYKTDRMSCKKYRLTRCRILIVRDLIRVLFLCSDLAVPINRINTVDFCYLEVQGALWNTSSYPYLEISDLQNWGKNKSSNHISQMNKTLLQQGISEPEFYGDLVYRFRKIVGKSNFSEQFRKLINRYKRTGYSLDIMRQTACLVVNPVIVDGYASLFNCTTAVRASGSKTASS